MIPKFAQNRDSSNRLAGNRHFVFAGPPQSQIHPVVCLLVPLELLTDENVNKHFAGIDATSREH